MKLLQTIPLFFCFTTAILINTTMSDKITSIQKCNVDTADVIIKVCVGTPDKKYDGLDYQHSVCAYQYKNEKLVIYEVIRFDLVYKDEKKQTSKVYHVTGKLFSRLDLF